MNYFNSLKKRLFLICILVFIIITLLFNSMYNYFIYKSKEYLIKINEHEITKEQLQTAYFMYQKKQENKLGKNFLNTTTNKKHTSKIYQLLLSQLINEILINEYIEKLNLNISNQAIKNFILQSENFKSNNVFNQAKYINFLNDNNIYSSTYENIVKKKLILRKFINLLINTDFMLKKEKNAILNILGEIRGFQSAKINFMPLINKQKIDKKEIYKYYDLHKSHFSTLEQIKVKFIKLNIDNIHIQLNNNEINNWYQSNIEKYTIPEQNQYNVIQTRNKQDAILVYNNLKKNIGSNKLSNLLSINIRSEKYKNNIIWIKKNELPFVIKNQNLIHIGDISKIITSRKGFVIIQLIDTKPKSIQKLSKIYNDVKNEAIQNKKLILFNNLQKKIHSITQNKTFTEINNIIDFYHIQFVNTKWFNKFSIPQEINSNKIKKCIFQRNILEQFQKKYKKNVFLFRINKKNLILIQITNYKKKSIIPLIHITNKIEKILKYKLAKKETINIVRTLVNKVKNNQIPCVEGICLKFNEIEYVAKNNTNLIDPLIFQVPYFKHQNKNIFSIVNTNKKTIKIIILKNYFLKKYSTIEKNKILSSIYKHYLKEILNSILTTLKKNAHIKYNIN